MPSISRKADHARQIICDLADELLTAKIGDKIEIQLKDEKIAFQRIE